MSESLTSESRPSYSLTEESQPSATIPESLTPTVILEPSPTTENIVKAKSKLSCPLCRGEVNDTVVVDAARSNICGSKEACEGLPVEAEIPRPKRSKKKRVTYDSVGLPVAPHPPKRLRADYRTTGGSVTGGKSPSVLN
ncbi:gypsy type transposase, partial [Tanacetum coccineum]